MEAMPAEVTLSTAMPGVWLCARPATLTWPSWRWLDEEGFGVQAGGGNTWLERAMDDPEQHLWVVTSNGKPIGKLHGRVTQQTNFIFGFVIDAPVRGRGYGRAALSEAMRQMRAQRNQKFELEVMTNNEQALNLYKSHGFAVVTAYDYYRLPVGGIAVQVVR